MFFILAITMQTRISLSSKVSKNLGCMPKTSAHVLSTSRKHRTELVLKILQECCGSTILTAVFYCGREVVVFLFRSLCPCRRR